MSKSRVTVMMKDSIMDAVTSYIKKGGNNETISDFFNRAVLNQLENDGNWEIRDIVEREE